MNCQPGDLARIVGLGALLEGADDRIVRLVNQPSENGFWLLETPIQARVRVFCRTGNDENNHLHPGDVSVFKGIHDDKLRPIRDLPGQDQMLRLAGKPPALDAKFKKGN